MTRSLSKASRAPAHDEDPVMTECGHWFARREEMERLFSIADAAAERLKAVGVTELSEPVLRASEDGLIFIDAWDRADALGHCNDAALRALPVIAATSLAGVRRKLEVAAAAMDAHESAEAHALLLSAIAELQC